VEALEILHLIHESGRGIIITERQLWLFAEVYTV
jgi:hypothetical protein